MFDVILFCEDSAHEQVISALLRKLAGAQDIRVHLSIRNAVGGQGKAVSEMEEFLNAFSAGREHLPDLIVVAVDANCKGLNRQLAEIMEKVPDALRDFFIGIIPDPHIERWLLLDSAAFRAVLGAGCPAPDLKCERNRYKNQLVKAVKTTGVSPLIGGLEHAEDIVMNMDIRRVRQSDPSFDRACGELERFFAAWKRNRK